MIKPNETVVINLGDSDNPDKRIATVVGIVSDFSPMFVIYIVFCPGVVEYDCFPIHDSMIEKE